MVRWLEGNSKWGMKLIDESILKDFVDKFVPAEYYHRDSLFMSDLVTLMLFVNRFIQRGTCSAI